MERTSLTYKTYLEILNRELVCAMGCTEPIAIAYCAAAARRALGALPTCIEVAASGNIITVSYTHLTLPTRSDV